MKKQLVIALILALVLSLALPAAAIAKRGGVPANGKDKAAKAQKGPEDKGKKDKAPELEADEAIEEEDGDEVEAPDGEVTLPTGWETAYASIKANVDRMQADVDAGIRKQVPPGLQRVLAKFMLRLGIEAEDETADPGVEEPGDGSEEPTDTVEPPLDDPLLDPTDD